MVYRDPNRSLSMDYRVRNLEIGIWIMGVWNFLYQSAFVLLDTRFLLA